MKAELIRQVDHAGRRLQVAHEVCPEKLTTTLTAVEHCQFARPQLVETPDETRMGFPSFRLPASFMETDMSVPAVQEPVFA